MGWIAPISLFPSIRLTSAVSGRSAAATCAASTRPSAAGASSVSAQPSSASRRIGSSTAWCSAVQVMRCRPAAARAAPTTARLSDSVAPLVNTTSPGRAPIAAATCSRASSTADDARIPHACCFEPALPKCSVNHGSIAATTAGSQGVVAWWSR
jgi:hypothetical protein